MICWAVLLSWGANELSWQHHFSYTVWGCVELNPEWQTGKQQPTAIVNVVKLCCRMCTALLCKHTLVTNWPPAAVSHALSLCPCFAEFLRAVHSLRGELSPGWQLSTYQTLSPRTGEGTAHTGTAANPAESSQQNSPQPALWSPPKECLLLTSCPALGIPGSASGAARWNDLYLGRAEVLQGLMIKKKKLVYLFIFPAHNDTK